MKTLPKSLLPVTALQGQLTQTHLTRKGEIAEQMGCRSLGKDQDKAGHSRTHTALQAPTLSRAANLNSASPSFVKPDLSLVPEVRIKSHF